MAICEKLLEVKDWKMYNSHTHIYVYIYIYNISYDFRDIKRTCCLPLGLLDIQKHHIRPLTLETKVNKNIFKDLDSVLKALTA